MFEFAPISDKIKALREKKDIKTGRIFNAERTRIYTEYYKAHEMEHPIMKRAGALLKWAEDRYVWINDDDFFAGSPGPAFRCVTNIIEWGCAGLAAAVNDTDENFKAAWQSPGAVYMSDEDREMFRDACEFWKDRTLTSRMASIVPDAIWNGIRGNGVTDFATRYAQLSDKPQGHFVANHDKAVHVGFAEVRRQAVEKMAEMEGKVFGNDARRYTFYRAVIKVCDAYITLAKRYAAVAAEKAEKATDPELKAKFAKMADSLEWLSANPARNYWEALETIVLYQLLLVTDAQQHGCSFGRIDQYAGYFLDDELAAGTITWDEAQELTDAFILKLAENLNNDRVPPNQVIIMMNKGGGMPAGGAGQHFSIGGVKKDGTDATNAATIMLLQTYGRLNIPDPSVSCRIHKNTPDIVWQLAVESSKLAGGMPTLENDDCIIPGLLTRGLSLEDARNYAIVGCVEPVGCGCEWSACGNTGLESFWCLIGCVVLAINGGKNPKTGWEGAKNCKMLYEYESFQEFKDAVEFQIHYWLDWHVTFCNFFELMYSENYPCIAASTMEEGCMESGLDVTWGGAKYNSTGLTCLGIGNVADCLMSIKKLCFDEKRYTLREMYDALQADWEGYEEMRQVIINEVPHFGNNIDEVDELGVWALGVYADHMNQSYGPRGYYRGGTFTMTSHIGYGAITTTTPDGRKAGEPLAEAISPRQGFDKNGPTALLASTSKLPHIKLMNGDQMNIRFSPAAVAGDEGTQKLREMFQTYFDLGGMQIQFNVVGTEELYSAQKDPEQYKDLIVRIAGFSVYFVEMPKVQQDDFISRTEQLR